MKYNNIFHAIIHNDKQWIKEYLCCQPADFKIDNLRTQEGATPLIISCKCGSLDLASFFIGVGADVNAKDGKGATALMYAANWPGLRMGKAEGLVSYLLEHGADVGDADLTGSTALMYCSHTGTADTAKLLISHGADVNAKSTANHMVEHISPNLAVIPATWGWESGDNAFLIACARNHPAMMDTLYKNGADIHLVNAMGHDAMYKLYYKKRSGNSKYINGLDLLLNYGMDINASVGETKTTILTNAIINGKEEKDIVDFLISRNADVNKADQYGRTPLHYAARYRHNGILRQLIKAGADIDPKDIEGNTPLLELQLKNAFLCSEREKRQYMRAAKCLVENGANPFNKNKDGLTFMDTDKLILNNGMPHRHVLAEIWDKYQKKHAKIIEDELPDREW